MNLLNIKLILVFNLTIVLRQIKIEDAIAKAKHKILWEGISEGV